MSDFSGGMVRWVALAAGCWLCCVVATSAHAQSLSQLLDLARGSDPSFLSARTNVNAAKARKDQAFGAMLPQLSANGNTNANDRSYQTRNSTAPAARDANYNSNSAQISLNQPIFRYANIVGWQQAGATVAQAEHQLLGAEQELLAKLTSAWFDVLAARDAMAFTTRQAEATQRQWEIVLRGAELGTHGEPQVDEARAKMDQALADAMTAETEFHLKWAALEQLTGPLPSRRLPFMRGVALLADLRHERLGGWLDMVETGNPSIQAAFQAYEAAGDEVRKQRAGHYPTLDMVASYGRNGQAVGGFPGQAGYDITQGSVGVQLSIPIYSGGTQSAKVDEALAQKEKARLDIEVARRAAILATKQAWFGWQAAFARAQAGVQAIRAAESTLAVARRGMENGLKTELDMLQAEQQLRAAQRDFRKGRYDQVVAFVRLKAAAGVLSGDDVSALDALLSQEMDAESEGGSAVVKVSER